MKKSKLLILSVLFPALVLLLLLGAMNAKSDDSCVVSFETCVKRVFYCIQWERRELLISSS